MQRDKKIKLGKSITALLLSIVLLVTSVPFTLAADPGTYDPIPTFNDDDAREVSASINADGGISVSFPEATVSVLKKAKTISGYMLELVDLGTYTSLHTDTVILRKIVKPTGTAPYSAEITKAEIKQKLSTGLLEDHRYNVSVVAFDSEGWFSEPVNSYVSDVPTFIYDESDYAPVTPNAYAAREILTFESKSDDDNHGTYSSYGTTERTQDDNNTRGKSASFDFMQEGNHLTYGGSTNDVGAKKYTYDASGNLTDYSRTKGYAMRIESAPTETVPQVFDVAWSRQTWDPAGASEVWFYVDFSQVSVTGLSFRLRSNDKWFAQDYDNSYTDAKNAFNRYGDIIYSTVGAAIGASKPGYTGEAPYLYLQQADGGWKKVLLSADGTVDLDHFCGYVSVPLKFMCSETDSIVTASNTEFGTTTPRIDGNPIYHGNLINNKTAERANKYYNDVIKLANPVVVDPAGTSISDALLVRHYAFTVDRPGTYSRYYVDGGMMLAPCMASSDGSKTTAELPKKAYIDADGNVVNRENGYKAIEDIMSAGFKFTGCTADSANPSLETSQNSIGKKIFLDNVLFYRTDGQQYSENTLNGAVNIGSPAKNYYDQETEIPRAIFNACQKYIDDPDWSDYRAVKYIDSLIAGYKKSIKDYNKTATEKIDASFLEDANLDAKATALGMASVWEKYKTAKAECEAAGTLGSENSGANDIIWKLARDLDKIPNITDSIAVTDEVKAEITRIYKVYSKLNLGQLDLLGDVAEQKLLDYFNYFQNVLQANSVVVGQKLTDNPFVPFNTFENLTPGTNAWRFENASNAGTLNEDYNYKKGFITWTGSFKSISGHSSHGQESTYWGDNETDQLKNPISMSEIKQYGGEAYISSNNGAQGTKGATLTIKNNLYDANSGYFNNMSFTKDCQDFSKYADLVKNNMGTSDVKLGDLSKKFTDTPGAIPLSLVFYADFSQLKNYSFTVTIGAGYDGSPNNFGVDLGSSYSDSYLYLLSPTTGEWVKATNETSPRMYNFTSDYSADTDGDGVKDLSLHNYKGYIMIPLFHFKRGLGGLITSNAKLDESAEALNSIFRVNIGVAPVSAEDARDMEGKSFTIDNVGFSYDKNFYSDKAAARGIDDKNFDELLQVKALPSEVFETNVSNIDVYGTGFATEVVNARALYNSLSDYQKTLESVKKADTLLKQYEAWVADTTLKPKPILDKDSTGIDETLSAINALPSEVKGTAKSDTVTGPDVQYPGGQNGLPYPGFVTAADGSVAVNYAAYGITQAQVDEIISIYEESYKRFSNDKKALLDVKTSATDTLTPAEKLQNAYLAAKRCKLLEEYLTEIKAFQTEVQGMYTRYDVNGTVINLLTLDGDGVTKLENAKNSYQTLPYYAKLLMQDATAMPAVYTQFANASKAVSKVLRNGKTYTDVIGATGAIDGGVVKLSKEYTALFNQTKGTLDAQTLFTASDLEKIKDTVDEYNSFLSAYAKIKQLYDGETVGSTANPEAAYGIEDILRLFPRYNADTTDKTVYLSKDKLSETDTYSVTYSEQLPSTTPVNTKINLTSANGKLLNALGENAAYDVKVTVNGSTNTYSAADLTAGVKLSDVANNTLTPGAPLTVNVEVSVPAELAVANAISDKLVFTYTDDAGTVLKDSTGKELKKTLEVIYTPNDAYTVTIPAEFNVAWDDSTDQSVDCKVSTSLKAGAKLNVAVTCNGTPDSAGAYTGAGQLTSSNPSFNLTYNYKGFDPSDFTGINTDVGLNTTPYLTVSGWDAVPVGEYKTTLTYTVTYTDATP
mgnify:FL=1